MASEMSYACRRCGERHHDLPMSYATDAPAYWETSLAGDKSSTLGQEQCVIKGEHFFVRGRLVIPVTGAARGTGLAQGISGARERRFCAFKTTMAGPALPHRPALV